MEVAANENEGEDEENNYVGHRFNLLHLLSLWFLGIVSTATAANKSLPVWISVCIWVGILLLVTIGIVRWTLIDFRTNASSNANANGNGNMNGNANANYSFERWNCSRDIRASILLFFVGAAPFVVALEFFHRLPDWTIVCASWAAGAGLFPLGVLMLMWAVKWCRFRAVFSNHTSSSSSNTTTTNDTARGSANASDNHRNRTSTTTTATATIVFWKKYWVSLWKLIGCYHLACGCGMYYLVWVTKSYDDPTPEQLQACPENDPLFEFDCDVIPLYRIWNTYYCGSILLILAGYKWHAAFV